MKNKSNEAAEGFQPIPDSFLIQHSGESVVRQTGPSLGYSRCCHIQQLK